MNTNREMKSINTNQPRTEARRDRQDGNSSWGGWKMKKEVGIRFESCRRIDSRAVGKPGVCAGILLPPP